MKRKLSHQNLAEEKLSEALKTFTTLEEKLKLGKELTKKESRLQDIVRSYGSGLQYRDPGLQYTSCTELYKFFSINFRKLPETALRVKLCARATYNAFFKKPLQLSIIA